MTPDMLSAEKPERDSNKRKDNDQLADILMAVDNMDLESVVIKPGRQQKRASEQAVKEEKPVVEKVEEPDIPLDQSQWRCKQCTFINTVEDWKDVNESHCQMCHQKDQGIYSQITALKQAARVQKVEDYCKECFGTISRTLGYCATCKIAARVDRSGKLD